MNSLSVAIVADTYTKQLHCVNLRNYGEFFDRLKVVLRTYIGNPDYATEIRSDLIKRILIDYFDLDVTIYPAAVMWEVWLDDKTYEWFMLKYG